MNTKQEPLIKPLQYFEIARWLIQVRKSRATFPDQHWGKVLDRALWDYDERYERKYTANYPDPYYDEDRVPKLLDRIIAPAFRNMVNEELAKLGYEQAKQTASTDPV